MDFPDWASALEAWAKSPQANAISPKITTLKVFLFTIIGLSSRDYRRSNYALITNYRCCQSAVTAFSALTSLDRDAWAEAFSTLACPHEEEARSAEEGGDGLRAKENYLKAYNYLRIARYPTTNSQGKKAAYLRCNENYLKASRYFEPPLERVEMRHRLLDTNSGWTYKPACKSHLHHHLYQEHFPYRDIEGLGFTPGDPVPVSPGSFLYIPRGTTYPNAAKLWVVWLLSEEGQELLDKVHGSGRPVFEGTQAAKMIKGKKVAWYEPKWQAKSRDILREILQAVGLPVAS